MQPSQTLLSENYLLQNEISNLKQISNQKEMLLNCGKTKLFIANFSVNYQFKPMLKIPCQNCQIETTDETKLLGYWLTKSMKPDTHVNFIVTKCYHCIWAVRKLKVSKKSSLIEAT